MSNIDVLFQIVQIILKLFPTFSFENSHYFMNTNEKHKRNNINISCNASEPQSFRKHRAR